MTSPAPHPPSLPDQPVPAAGSPTAEPLLLSGPLVVAGRFEGEQCWRVPLPHGIDPEDLGRFARGLPEVTRSPGGQIVLTYDLVSRADQPHLPDRVESVARPPRAPGLVVGPGEQVLAVQRVAASVLVWADGQLLATRYSGVTSAPGAWALPGGGVDPDEDPRAGARRECWEETGQEVLVGDLIRLFSRHWVGRAPSGRLEDFHAVNLVFAARCPAPGPTQVHDMGGSTAAAAWVPAAQVAGLDWARAHRWVASSVPG